MAASALEGLAVKERLEDVQKRAMAALVEAKNAVATSLAAPPATRVTVVQDDEENGKSTVQIGETTVSIAAALNVVQFKEARCSPPPPPPPSLALIVP
jgi:hypothetical protein